MRLKQITPFIPCMHLKTQIGFYRDVLGFEVTFETEGYAFLRCDDVAIRLVQVGDQVDLAHPEREGSFYIDVDDIEGLFARMKPELDRLPAARVRAPFNQDYGQREFHVADEDCTLVFFGAPLEEL